MDFPQPISVQDLATRLNATDLLGDIHNKALGINEIHHVRAGDITFSDVEKYFEKALTSAATIIILNKTVSQIPERKTIIIHPQPFAAYDQIVRWHRPFTPLSISPEKTAKIHPTAVIEPNVVIGNCVEIGENSYVQANAVLHDYTIIGKNCQIGAGALIGTDAFYFKKYNRAEDSDAPKFEKWRSGGRVVIADHVDIGAGTTINKGVSTDTIIGMGTKIDCQVHIGHDVQIGKNCLIAAQVGISGNTVLEDDVVVYGQAGIAQNLRIGKGATISAKAGVSKDLEGGKLYFGVPAQEARLAYRELAVLRRLAK